MRVSEGARIAAQGVQTMVPISHITSIAQMIEFARNNGLLQYEPITVDGITITTTIRSMFDILSLTKTGITVTINLYDADTNDAQYTSIEYAVNELFNALDRKNRTQTAR